MSEYFTRILFIAFIMLMLNIGFAASMDSASPESDGNQLYINSMVGDVIDAGEAKYYGIFSDIEGFESAAFYEYEDVYDSAEAAQRLPESSLKYIVVRIMRTAGNGSGSLENTDSCGGGRIVIEKRARIDQDVFQTLSRYILFYKDIINNDSLCKMFVGNNKIEWPLVTATKIESAEADFRKRRQTNGIYCMSCFGSSAAYAGSLIGTEVTRSYDCISYYQIDLKWVLGMAAAGAGTAYGLNYLLYPNDVKVEALRHGIIAFDNNNMPITEQEAESLFVDKGFDWGFAGCMTLGCLSSAATPMALLYPWALMSPETNMDCLLTILPIVAVSGAEFNMLLKMSKDYARKRDRQAAIERIKKKREEKRIQR